MGQERREWPVLREGCGGREVHELQIALERRGFVTDEDEQRWWQFGSSTHSALETFQVGGFPCNMCHHSSITLFWNLMPSNRLIYPSCRVRDHSVGHRIY